MDDDDLLIALGARERARGPAPEWEALARGDIDEDEAVRRARERGATPSEIERARELFAPRPSEHDDALADRLLGGAPAAVVQLPRRRSLAWIVPVATLAAAASLVLWLASRPISDGEGPGLLPAHELWIEPAAAKVRSARGSVRMHAGDSMVFFLRPESSYTAPPHVWACLADDSGTRTLATRTRAGEPGRTLEVEATLPADLRPGAWDLVAVLAFTPRPDDDRVACDVAAQPTWRVERVGFVVDPR